MTSYGRFATSAGKGFLGYPNGRSDDGGWTERRHLIRTSIAKK